MSYDYMDWNFVSYLFDKMGFGPQWKKWMSACVEGSSYSVLVWRALPRNPLKPKEVLGSVIRCPHSSAL